MVSTHVETMADAVIRTAKTMSAAGSAVIATDTSGTILYWDEVAESLYGWRAAEALNRNIVDVTPGQQSMAEAESIMRQLLAGKEWSGTFLVRHKDGTPIIVHVTDVPVLVDGTVVGIVGVSRRV